MQVNSGCRRQCILLQQLPKSSLELVLHKLDLNSLACTAVTCSKLSRAVPASITKLAVNIKTQQQLNSFVAWLQLHDSRIIQCSLTGVGSGSRGIQLKNLPCSQLRQLNIEHLQVHLDLTQFFPGVLHDCTGLTALDLQRCQIWDSEAAFTAFAALPELCSLSLHKSGNLGARHHLLGDLQLSTKLTKLHLDMLRAHNELYQSLSQFSGLVSLEELHLRNLRPVGLPGCLPSQLQKLTRLHLAFRDIECDSTEQFQHLSHLTALQDLTIKSDDDCFCGGHALPGMQQLSRLTSLELSCSLLELSTANTQRWASSLTALERLSLSNCEVEPEALGAFTQLQALSATRIVIRAPIQGCELLPAASKLSSLTQLCIVKVFERPNRTTVPQELPFGACTALTVSTNMCSLQLGLEASVAPAGCDLFSPGTVYPHLRLINLQHESVYVGMPVSGPQLQQLCSCCPAVECLAFAIKSSDFSPEAFSSLLQLSALTSLQIRGMGAAAAAAAAAATKAATAAKQAAAAKHAAAAAAAQTAAVAVAAQAAAVAAAAAAAVAAAAAGAAAVDVAAQLTALKQLELAELPHLTESSLQLTALTALEHLTLGFAKGPWVGQPSCSKWHLRSKAQSGDPPDVWVQLLNELLEDAACRQALLQRSSAIEAAPAELMLAQLAATLAEEMAARKVAQLAAGDAAQH